MKRQNLVRSISGALLGSVFVLWGFMSIAQTTAETETKALAKPPAAALKGKGERKMSATGEPLPRTEREWKKILTPEQYEVLRKKGTERAFTGKFWNTKDAGIYRCAGCGEILFESDTKFDSGCGWPSFDKPADGKVIDEHEDRSHFMRRTEVVCSKCQGHLGHVFNDGPTATGLRYCINSASLTFEEAEGEKKQTEPTVKPEEVEPKH